MGKSRRRTVYDFLMSIDYGICHGPVDHVNQIFVKDKRVAGGKYTERTDIDVYLPNLFGGDNGEGGPAGTIEVYPGSDTQMMSAELASRYDGLPEDLPGYRGLAHLFFRGRTGWTDLNLITLMKYLLENGFDLSGIKTLGFKWATNNPYLAPAKVNVTRLPKTLGPGYALIPPTVGVNEDGTLRSHEYTQLVVRDGSFDTSAHFLRMDNGFGTQYGEFAVTKIDLAENGLARADLQGMIDALMVPTAVLKLRLEQVNTAGTSSLSYDFVVINENGSEERRSLRDAPISDFDETEVIIPLTADAVRVEALATYRQPQGSLISKEAKVELGVFKGGSSFTAYPIYDGSPKSWDTNPGLIKACSHESNGAFSAKLGVTHWMGSLGMDEPSPGTGILEARPFYYDENDEIVPLSPPSGPNEIWSSFASGDRVETKIRGTAPPGATHVQIRASVSTQWAVWDYRLEQTINEASVSSDEREDSPLFPDGSSGLTLLPDANPAHVIHEVLVDPEWGKGEDPYLIDGSSFEDAAETLYNEKFGLSFAWHRQTEIESFIQEVLDHISAVLFQHPASGLWTLKLLRGDYDPNSLPDFGPHNCTARNRKRKGWGETINEIVASYTNPEDETDATVSAHNMANVQIQGGVISETRDYYAIRNPWLAQHVADRDVRAAGYPLFSCTLHVDRTAWNLTPGSVIKLSWPEDGFEEMIVRVTRVDYGKKKARRIKLDVVEDIFGLPQVQYTAPQESLSDPAVEPNPRPLTAQVAMTVPYPLLARQGVTPEDVDLNPDGAAITFLADDDAFRYADIEVHTSVTDPTGREGVQSIANFPPVDSVLLTEAWLPEAESRLPDLYAISLFGYEADPGEMLMLGETEEESEIIMLEAYVEAVLDGAGDVVEAAYWRVARGCWDTVPLAWPSGTRLWRLPESDERSDPSERAAGETLSYRFLPRTSRARLPYGLAPGVSIVATNRAFAPFRPAATQLDSSGFGGVDYSDPNTWPATVTATWATRDRTTEDAVVVRWDEASVTPEPGQTVTLNILRLDGAVAETITGLTGTSHAIPASSLSGVLNGWVEFLSERDGETSLFGARIPFSFGGGYGQNYGVAYGP